MHINLLFIVLSLKISENVVLIFLGKLNRKNMLQNQQFYQLIMYQGQSGILMDKTMADKLMYIPNDYTQNYPFCRLQVVVKTFGHSTYRINQSKFNKCPQSCYANE